MPSINGNILSLVPGAWKVILAIAGIATAGWIANGRLSEVTSVVPRVSVVEEKQAEMEKHHAEIHRDVDVIRERLNDTRQEVYETRQDIRALRTGRPLGPIEAPVPDVEEGKHEPR